MRTTFGGFEIARSGIRISQHALNVTGHNIANAETPGYTRQRLELEASNPYGVIRRMAPVEDAIYGQGVRTIQVMQVRDTFLDRQFRTASTSLSYWTTRSSSLGVIESMFDESADHSLSGAMSDFFKAMNDLFQYPADAGVRVSIRENANKLTETFNAHYNTFKDSVDNENESVKVNVDQINELSERIASLNKDIYAFEVTGNTANDLRDQRNLLMDELATITDISYTTDSDGKMTVYMGGDVLINHKDFNKLKVEADQPHTITGEANKMYTVKWDTGPNAGQDATITGGEMKAHLDLRDGSTESDIGYPYYVEKLNTMAKKIAEAVNAIHVKGHTYPYTDKNGVAHASQTGINFFDAATTTAGNFKLSDDILTSEFNIAASNIEVILTGDNQQAGNQLIALEISKLFSETEVPGLNGSFDSYYRGIVVELGVQTQKANNMVESQYALAASTEQQRLSVSAVSLDEEMTSLVQFQHSYSAAARLLTTLDEALETLINRTGRVGL